MVKSQKCWVKRKGIETYCAFVQSAKSEKINNILCWDMYICGKTVGKASKWVIRNMGFCLLLGRQGLVEEGGPQRGAHTQGFKDTSYRTSRGSSGWESTCKAGDEGLIPGLKRIHVPQGNWVCGPRLLRLHSGAREPQQEKPLQWRARTAAGEEPPAQGNESKPARRNPDPGQPITINNTINVLLIFYF